LLPAGESDCGDFVSVGNGHKERARVAEIGRLPFGRTAAGITRRDFVRSALASSALFGFGCGSGSNYTPPNPPQSVCGSLDCAIVGAGIAGMSAANTLMAAAKTCWCSKRATALVGGR
jgi:hypothetical protein